MLKFRTEAWTDFLRENRQQLKEGLDVVAGAIPYMIGNDKPPGMTRFLEVLTGLGRTRPEDVLQFIEFDGNEEADAETAGPERDRLSGAT